MTNPTNPTKTESVKGLKVVTPESINVTPAQVATIRQALNVDRHQYGLAMATTWKHFGDIISRIKAGKKDGTFDGKIEDLVNGLFECKISEDDRSYSVKMAKDDGILEWYEKTQCTKYNPRTIWTAYKPKKKAEKSEDSEENENSDNETPEDDKIPTYTAIVQHMTNFMDGFRKASANGDLTTEQLDTIKKSMEVYTAEISKDHAVQVKGDKVDQARKEKKTA